MTERVYDPVMVQIRSADGKFIPNWEDFVEADDLEHAKECIRLEKIQDRIPPRQRYNYRIVALDTPTQGELRV